MIDDELAVSMEDLPAEFLPQAVFLAQAEFEAEEAEMIVDLEEWEVASDQSSLDSDFDPEEEMDWDLPEQVYIENYPRAFDPENPLPS
jgi:hypothetical protein